MDAKQLRDILEKHRKWLRSEAGGERANLRSADLRGTDLRGADLRGADLRDADLGGAYLRSADLRGADLGGADHLGIKTDADTKVDDGRLIGMPQHAIWVRTDGTISIGCQRHSLDHWLDRHREIGLAASYSEKDIQLYGDQLEQLKGD